MKAPVADDTGEGDRRFLCIYHGLGVRVRDLKDAQPGAVTVMKC